MGLPVIAQDATAPRLAPSRILSVIRRQPRKDLRGSMSKELGWPVRVFDTRRCELGEGPLWDDANDRVLWVDILNSRVLWRTLTSDGPGSFQCPRHVGAVLPLDDGRWLLCLRDGLYTTDLASGKLTEVAAFPHSPECNVNRPHRLRANDAKVSPRGVAYLGTMAYDPEGDAGSAALYVLDAGQLKTVLTGVTISNGMGWSPDGAIMYYIDSPTGRIDRCWGDGLKTPLRREPFIAVDPRIGVPDGMCVDADGYLWVAIWGGGCVMRFAPDGSSAGRISLPCPQVTSCAFAGPDLRTLVITTAAEGLPSDPGSSEPGLGMTYAVQAQVAGQVQPRIRTEHIKPKRDS